MKYLFLLILNSCWLLEEKKPLPWSGPVVGGSYACQESINDIKQCSCNYRYGDHMDDLMYVPCRINGYKSPEEAVLIGGMTGGWIYAQFPIKVTNCSTGKGYRMCDCIWPSGNPEWYNQPVACFVTKEFKEWPLK